ncbi:GatB/YqeY domain-containing protein [Pontibaca methylaminivorans]|uniref:GatB/YqeY domain-containing protein n=1 Tax=Pontibaca methylaminivorans TaxID=515897 RepID=A0A1R3WI32_9RHOB|nr:GatB/YqeY domain-containing protein [Pontibaca methylaminivorans]SIT77512.1 hypothetical protein SAMN05421849_0756 [Pontibaca methylaminivorans]
MDMRTRISEAIKQAMKERATSRLSTLRLINAAIKDQDIAVRAQEGDASVGDAEILAILSRMVKQRMESAHAYEEGGRLDLAEHERDEIGIINEFLPRQLTDDEVEAAIDDAITRLEAGSIRDMGRVMADLKAQYGGQMNFAVVGPMVKARLCGE